MSTRAAGTGRMELAEFRCRLCDGDELVLYYRQGADGRFRYYKCRCCGLVNLDLARGLDQEQYTLDLADPMDDGLRRHRAIDASFDFIHRHVGGPGRLLDIGCGNGRLLHVARRAGWEVEGLELSAEAAANVRERLGIQVLAADFMQEGPLEEEAEAYDVVCLRHVLEHLPDSRLAMRKIRRLLKPDGYLLLEMPNVEGLDKKLKRILSRLGIHSRRYSKDFVAGHCNEFCKQSLRYLIEASGFHLIRWETYSKKPLANLIYNHVHIGNKARALLRKTGD